MRLKNYFHKTFVWIINSHWRSASMARYISHKLPERISTQIWFFYITGRFLNITNPETLTDKINWLKLNDKNPAYKKYVDRESVRAYVAEKSPDCAMALILLKTQNISAAQWDALPNRFVLKASHGAGMVKIIKDKRKASLEEIQAVVREWLSLDYSALYREWVYKDLDRYVIAEEFLSDINGAIPNDFKFFCLNGKVAFVCVDFGRFSNLHRSVFDSDFNLIDVKLTYPLGPQIQKPAIYEKAREIAERLSSEITFARVDLYLLDESVYFGEITLIPGAGRLNFTPSDFDRKMGARLTINHRSPAQSGCPHAS